MLERLERSELQVQGYGAKYVRVSIQTKVGSFTYFLCVPLHRENEVLLEREVKLGPVGYRVPKVVLVHLDQMG